MRFLVISGFDWISIHTDKLKMEVRDNCGDNFGKFNGSKRSVRRNVRPEFGGDKVIGRGMGWDEG